MAGVFSLFKFVDELLDHLLDGGFQPASVAALALVPAVFIAWADGSVTQNERQAVIISEERFLLFEWILRRNDDPNLVQIGVFGHVIRDDEVSNVNRIKGPEVQSYFHDFSMNSRTIRSASKIA